MIRSVQLTVRGRAAGTGAGVLPSSAAIIAAFCEVTRPSRHSGQVVLDLGHVLALHHQRRWEAEQLASAPGSSLAAMAAGKRLSKDLGARRWVLIERIDEWVSQRLPTSCQGDPDTEPLGSVIDRMAISWVRADNLRHAGDRSLARAALRQLSGIAREYDDLLHDLGAGRRRLPAWRSQVPVWHDRW